MTCARSRCPTAAGCAAAASSSPPAWTTAASTCPELEALVGRGVFYGAAVSEAPSMMGEHGLRRRAAATRPARPRSTSPATRDRSPSSCAARRWPPACRTTSSPSSQATRNVAIRYRTAVLGGRAVDGCLAGSDGGRPRRRRRPRRSPAGGLFVLIGSVPRTSWLPDEVGRDQAGFVRTGPDSRRRRGRRSAMTRLPLETSMPGVFAVGDVRAGSIKRVATAVGDGATVIALLHGYLAAAPRPRGTSVSRRHVAGRDQRSPARCARILVLAACLVFLAGLQLTSSRCARPTGSPGPSTSR